MLKAASPTSASEHFEFPAQNTFTKGGCLCLGGKKSVNWTSFLGGDICTQPVWAVQDSYQVVQLLYQSSSMKILDNLLKHRELSKSHSEKHYHTVS